MGFLRNPVKSIQGTINDVGKALKPIVAPAEKAVAATVSAVAGTFGIPITPSQVNTLATGIKTSTYAKPSGGGSAAAPAPSAALPTTPANVPSTSFWSNLGNVLNPTPVPAPTGTSPLMSAGGSNTWMVVGAVGLAAFALWKIAK